MPTIYIDSVPHDVPEGKNLLEACLALGFDLPYFCWHPAMGSVGACRQCAVRKFEDEDDEKGRIVMACMEAAVDGVRISIADEEAAAFRANVIEWLMVNHPHDCPVCDEGGECHLQDMTVMTGHTARRYRFNKRTHHNQDLGPFINHEMNRCIQCYRCVRFYRDHAGGRDLDAFASHDHVYFGRHEDGTLESEFSGNLVEVCPTGVFTDKTFKEHFTRKWDLTTAPSVCHECALGCNIIAGARYGSLRRVRSRYNADVNGYFICDRGRFGHGYVTGEHRLRMPLGKAEASGNTSSGNANSDRSDANTNQGDANPQSATNTEGLQEISWEDALTTLKSVIGDARLTGIGSPRATLEANFLLRELVGQERWHQGTDRRMTRMMRRIVDLLRNGPCATPSLAEMEEADAVLILGEDVTNTAPMMDLALRQAVQAKPKKVAEKLNIPPWHDAALREAVQDQRSPLFVLTPDRTKLDAISREALRLPPDEIARMGFAIAHALDDRAHDVTDLDNDLREKAAEIARMLSEAERPLIIGGTSLRSEDCIRAAGNVAWALARAHPHARLAFTVPECNSMGHALIGGESMEALLEDEEAAAAADDDVLLVLENDLFRRMPADRVRAMLARFRTVISIDSIRHATTEASDLALPCTAFDGNDGTLVSSEGRAQRFFRVHAEENTDRESWRILRELLLLRRGDDGGVPDSLHAVTEAVEAADPAFDGILAAAPPPDFRIEGAKIPRQSHRYSGRTAMHADRDVREHAPPADSESPLSFSMEGAQGHAPPPLIARYWSGGWNSVQAINKYQIEVGGALHGGDPGRRLFAPAAGGGADAAGSHYDTDIPPRFEAREGQWTIIPLPRIFGSGELSALAPAIGERIPAPFAVLNTADARALGLSDGAMVRLFAGDAAVELRAELRDDFPSGCAGVCDGFPGMPHIAYPATGKIETAGGEA